MTEEYHFAVNDYFCHYKNKVVPFEEFMLQYHRRIGYYGKTDSASYFLRRLSDDEIFLCKDGDVTIEDGDQFKLVPMKYYEETMQEIREIEDLLPVPAFIPQAEVAATQTVERDKEDVQTIQYRGYEIEQHQDSFIVESFHGYEKKFQSLDTAKKFVDKQNDWEDGVR